MLAKTEDGDQADSADRLIGRPRRLAVPLAVLLFEMLSNRGKENEGTGNTRWNEQYELKLRNTWSSELQQSAQV